MAKFVSISGPSTTGKTSLIESLSTYREFSGKNIVFSPDMYDVAWNELVQKGLFSEFSEITKDYEYLCVFIMRLIDYYNDYIDSFKDSDALVVLDSCWLDVSIYAILNMWYNSIIHSVQEEILYKSSLYDERISRVYLTKADDANYPVDRFRLRGDIKTFRDNRDLELRYYDLVKHLAIAKPLPSSDISESSLFIIEDLRNLGYL